MKIRNVCVRFCVKIKFQCGVLLQNSEWVIVMDYEIWFAAHLHYGINYEILYFSLGPL